MAQLHADAVMVLVGLTVGLLALVYALRLPRGSRRAAAVLLGVELAQGVIGYTQYFLHVPPVLVALHMLGACLVWLAALQVLLAVRREPAPVRQVRRARRPRSACPRRSARRSPELRCTGSRRRTKPLRPPTTSFRSAGSA